MGKKLVVKFDKQQLVVENGSNNLDVATFSESDDEGVRKARRSRDKPRKRYDDVSGQENEDDDGFEEEESPKSKRGRPKKTTTTPSPEENVKKKRGRPKKTENGDNRKRLMRRISLQH